MLLVLRSDVSVCVCLCVCESEREREREGERESEIFSTLHCCCVNSVSLSPCHDLYVRLQLDGIKRV